LKEIEVIGFFMPRPHKIGLDYFPHDCDLSNDEKVETIEMLYGNDGYAIFLKLLERIYRNGGELIISDAETIEILAKKCNVTLKRFSEIVTHLVKFGLFSSEKYENKILTSNGIMKRTKIVTDKRFAMQEKYLKKVSDAETHQKLIRNSSETPQSKEKESKEKERKEKYSTEKERKEEKPFVFSFLSSCSNKFKTTWNQYLEMRQKIRKPATERAKELILAKLNKLSSDEDIQVKILEQSIENSWQGVFELRQQKKTESMHPKSEEGKYDKYE